MKDDTLWFSGVFLRGERHLSAAINLMRPLESQLTGTFPSHNLQPVTIYICKKYDIFCMYASCHLHSIFLLPSWDFNLITRVQKSPIGKWDTHVLLFSSCMDISLTHWGWLMHICISNLTIIGSDNGLSPGWCQAIIRTKAGILLVGPIGTNISEILIKIHIFSFAKKQFEMLPAKW